MKPTKIKAWPELVDYLSSLPLLREPTLDPLPEAREIEIDFGSVRVVTSTGLTVFLLRLLRTLKKQNTVAIRSDCSPSARDELDRLGAFAHLGGPLHALQHEFVLGNAVPETIYAPKQDMVKLPIYRLSFNGTPDRRQAVHAFVKLISGALAPLAKIYNLPANGLAMLLNEIAKNTADHAGHDALFGMDVIPASAGSARLTFCFGDLGPGIKNHIEKNMPAELADRHRHMSLYEAYRLALRPGYTSCSSQLNRGYGMSIIIQCAIDMNIHLSIFDATSRGLLSHINTSEPPSHASVRRIFHNIGHDVGFYYYGEMILIPTRP